MKKTAIWLAAISMTVFLIAWAFGGLMIYNGDYENSVWVYVGAVCLIAFFVCLVYLKIRKCPHCGRINQTGGAFCPYCGKEMH